MAWTFDPLQSLNSHFNFGKLGVVAETYFENLYGETTSLLHQGSPTDRLLAAWHLDTARVAARERGERGRAGTGDRRRPGQCLRGSVGC